MNLTKASANELLELIKGLAFKSKKDCVVTLSYKIEIGIFVQSFKIDLKHNE